MMGRANTIIRGYVFGYVKPATIVLAIIMPFTDDQFAGLLPISLMFDPAMRDSGLLQCNNSK